MIEKALQYIQTLYAQNDDVLMFHGFSFISEVYLRAKELSRSYALGEQEMEELYLAAMFYCTGYKSGSGNPLKSSIQLAKSFLEKQSCPKDQLENVLSLIAERPHSGSSISSRILHDAAHAWQGQKGLADRISLLRIERESCHNRRYTDQNWEELIYAYLLRGKFYTPEARERYEERRHKNIIKQRAKISKARKETTRRKTGKEFGRAVDTLYRTNFNNHISLSSIADGKANMMISINTIILSVIVTFSGAGFTFSGTYLIEHFRYTVPIFVLLFGCMISVIFAIISARPKVTSSEPDMDLISSKKASLLFFGNFSKIPLPSFVKHLSRLKQSQQELYDSMSVDMYYLGVVLDRKYRLLNWSYTTFMIALTTSVVAFSVIFFYTNLS